MQEHTDWLKKYGDIMLITKSNGAWSASIMLNDGHVCTVEFFTDIDECTRELCDEVCLYLGDDCK